MDCTGRAEVLALVALVVAGLVILIVGIYVGLKSSVEEECIFHSYSHDSKTWTCSAYRENTIYPYANTGRALFSVGLVTLLLGIILSALEASRDASADE